MNIPEYTFYVWIGGVEVDPLSGLVDTAHVYEEAQYVFSKKLVNVIVEHNKNSFYIVQLLEADDKTK